MATSQRRRRAQQADRHRTFGKFAEGEPRGRKCSIVGLDRPRPARSTRIEGRPVVGLISAADLDLERSSNFGLVPSQGAQTMCDKCDEIDGRLVRYRQLSSAVTDKLALESIDRLIADLEYQKTLLHPKPEDQAH
jgi:hypothetical protein